MVTSEPHISRARSRQQSTAGLMATRSASVRMRLRRTGKYAVCAAIYYTGLFHLIRAWNNFRGRRLTIVTFHRIADRPDDDPYSLPTLFMSQENFQLTLQFLARHYRWLSLQELTEAIRTGAPVPANSVLLTFDDGYRDIFDEALPLLVRERIPASVFLPTGLVGASSAFWWDRLYFLLQALARKPEQLVRVIEQVQDPALRESLHTIAEAGSLDDRRAAIITWISELQEQPADRVEGLMTLLSRGAEVGQTTFSRYNQIASWDEIVAQCHGRIAAGSHTRRHLFLDRELPETAREEIIGSKQDLEAHLGQAASAFAYPGGRVNGAVKRWVQEAGYACAMTTEPGINRADDDPYALKRINVWNGTVTSGNGRFWAPQFAFKLLGLA